MKKLIAVGALVLLGASALGAEGIDLGDFPLGTWLDANWNAYWEFSSDDIRIVDDQGALYFDFGNATVEDWKIAPSTGGLELTFSCAETGKTYVFTKPATNLNLQMKIVREGAEDYIIEMKYQEGSIGG